LHGSESSAAINQQKKAGTVVESFESADVKTVSVISTLAGKKKINIPVRQLAVVEERIETSTLPVARKTVEKERTTQVVIATIPEPVKDIETNVSTPNESLAISTKADDEMQDMTPKQTRIKSVGSLVNFVVGKVDKRKNKIIEFEDNDEGTKVSGLNLRLLKFQSKD
jgi:hypothetical protein